MIDQDSNGQSRSRAYTGVLNSPALTGRAEFLAGEDALEMSAGGRTVILPYSAVQSLKHENFTVRAEADDGVYEFSRLGSEEDWFYDEFLKALNQKVQTSFFESGAPLVEIEARCLLTDETGQFSGSAVVRVFDRCVLILTPDRSARRLPLGFLKALEKEPYSVRLTFTSGENLTLFEAGFDLNPLLDTLDDALDRLAKKRVSDLKTLLPNLSSSDASRLTSTYRMDTAIPVTAMPPALENAMRGHFTGNMAATYPRLKTLGDYKALALGYAAVTDGEIPYSGRSGFSDTGDQAANRGNAADEGAAKRGDAAVRGNEADDGVSDRGNAVDRGNEADDGNAADDDAATTFADSADPFPDAADPFPDATPAFTDSPDPELSSQGSVSIFWAVLPSEDHRYAALELCLPEEAAAATYIFRTGGSFDDFLLLFGRAFEACRFRREFLTFTDAELPEKAAGAYKILIDRTPSLMRLRSLTAGRIIHSSPDAWEQKLVKAFAGNGEDSASATARGTAPAGAGNPVAGETSFSATPTRFCPSCGCRISSSVRFCTECGKKL